MYKDIFFRYVTLLIIYFSISMLTILFTYFYTYFVFSLFSLFPFATISSSILTFSNQDFSFRIIDACIAISSYLLIAFIFLTLPLKFSKSLRLTIKSWILFTLFNIFRMILLIGIFLLFGKEIFDYLHILFYEILTGLITLLIILYYLRKNTTSSEYPIISDIKYITSSIKKK